MPAIIYIDLSSLELKLRSHYVKSYRIRSFSGPHFSAFGLNKEKLKAPNRETFYAMTVFTTEKYVCLNRSRRRLASQVCLKFKKKEINQIFSCEVNYLIFVWKMLI